MKARKAPLALLLSAALSLTLGFAPAAAAEEEEEPLAIELGSSVTLLPRAQYRPRLLLHGDRDLSSGQHYNAVSQRLRFGAEARVDDWLSMVIELQDVRTWGEETSTLGDFSADGFDVHQAYGELRIGEELLKIRLGRQELALDNQRLVGAVGWSNQGRSFDGVVVSHACPMLDLKLFYFVTGEQDALREQTLPGSDSVVVAGSRKDAHFAGLHGRLKRFSFARPSLIALWDTATVLTGVQHRATFGLFVDSAPLGGLRYQGELYLQLGQRENPLSGDQDLQGLFGAGQLSYTAPVPWKPTLLARFEYASGDDDPTDDKIKSFDTLYATNHGKYGLMDFFTNLPVHTGRGGLMDFGGRLSVEPLEGLLAFVDLHLFRLAETPAGGEAALGTEIDFLLRYTLNRHLAVEGVFATMIPDDALSALRGGGDKAELYGYLQLDLRL